MKMVDVVTKQTVSSDSTSENVLFPPYLTHKETSFHTRNLPDPTRIRFPTLIPILTNRTSTEDDEIGVFRAEKYFNGSIDDADESETCSRVFSSTATRLSHRDRSGYEPSGRSTTTSVNLEQVRARIQPRTPSSVRSDSSWHSRSVLIKEDGRRTVNRFNPPERPKRKARNVKKLLASFGCILCSNKHSLRTKEIGEISLRPNLNVDPVQVQEPPKGDALLGAVAEITPPKGDALLGASFRSAELFRRRCNSPEVYGSSPAQKTMSLERRLTVMPWERQLRKLEEVVVAADSGSDASSDLFEIDSLTGKTGAGGGRRASDDLSASGFETPTTGYAPSEASIQWSVVTASAADYASVLSDCDEAMYRRRSPPGSSSAARELARRRRALLGCKSKRVVNVTGPGYEPGSMDFTADTPARFQAQIARIEQQFTHLTSPTPRNNSRLFYIK